MVAGAAAAASRWHAAIRTRLLVLPQRIRNRRRDTSRTPDGLGARSTSGRMRNLPTPRCVARFTVSADRPTVVTCQMQAQDGAADDLLATLLVAALTRAVRGSGLRHGLADDRAAATLRRSTWRRTHSSARGPTGRPGLHVHDRCAEQQGRGCGAVHGGRFHTLPPQHRGDGLSMSGASDQYLTACWEPSHLSIRTRPDARDAPGPEPGEAAASEAVGRYLERRQPRPHHHSHLRTRWFAAYEQGF